jgi:hypothetical protein
LLSVAPAALASLGTGGAEVFGYGNVFARELGSIGQIPTDDFASRFASGADYLSGISWNPTNAAYWNGFNADIDIANQGKAPGSPGYRTFDYRLNAEELARFQQNGFVVSERLQRPSFGEAFITSGITNCPFSFPPTDPARVASHLRRHAEEIEETYLFNAVETMLAGMAAQIPNAAGEAGGGLRDSLLTRTISSRWPVHCWPTARRHRLNQTSELRRH